MYTVYWCNLTIRFVFCGGNVLAAGFWQLIFLIFIYQPYPYNYLPFWACFPLSVHLIISPPPPPFFLLGCFSYKQLYIYISQLPPIRLGHSCGWFLATDAWWHLSLDHLHRAQVLLGLIAPQFNAPSSWKKRQWSDQSANFLGSKWSNKNLACLFFIFLLNQSLKFKETVSLSLKISSFRSKRTLRFSKKNLVTDFYCCLWEKREGCPLVN